MRRQALLAGPRLKLVGVLVVLGVAAAACGGGNGAGSSVGVETAETAPEAALSEAVASGDSFSTRAHAGIVAAGGVPQAVRSDNPCEQPAAAAGKPITIGYVGVNLAELEAVGLETLTFEDPGALIYAYVNGLNFNGGINGRCVQLVQHIWSLRDTAESFGRLCAELPQQGPSIVLSLGLSQATFECITLAAELPTLGLYATMADSQFAAARGRMFLDQGSYEHLLWIGLRSALQGGALTVGDRIGLFGVPSGVAALMTEDLGLSVADTATVPPEFADLAILGIERQARLLEGDLSDSEMQGALSFRDQLTPDQTDVLRRIELHFLEIAQRFRAAGVAAVVTSAEWSDVRRLMRAAELVGWFPRWIINDSQPASLVLTNVPRAQADNLVQISARRAAGDEIPDLDRGCLSLRNTFSDEAAFSHRFHSDAWNLLTATCDYLDVVFGAISRVDGPVTHQALVQALAATHYETAYGSLIEFGSTDRFGYDRFRILVADPNCLLDAWGCMRAATGWLMPSEAEAQ